MPLGNRIRIVAVAAALLSGCVAAHRSAITPASALRVMSYNIKSGNGDLARTAQAIRDQAPDIVALQEVDVHWADRSAFADEATELGKRLHMHVRFARIYDLPGVAGAPDREFGVALLSRFPVVRFRNDTITRLSTQDPQPVPTPMPGLLDAELDVHGRTVRVFNTHLDYRKEPRVRERQVRDMLAYVNGDTLPTLVFGDMNAPPSASELQPLLERFRDAWNDSAGPGFTYPAEAPSERIDYVLVSSRFMVRGARVPDTQASDHRPVVVDLTMR